MKLLRGMMAALCVGALVVGTVALHAEAKDKDKDEAGRGHERWDRFEMMKKKLDLSDKQVDQLKDAQKEGRESGKLLLDKLKADQASLAVLVDKKASDADLKAALDTLQSDRDAMRAQGQKRREAMQAILTPLQQAKMVGMMGGFGHGRGHGGTPAGCQSKGGQGGWMGGADKD